MKRIHPRLRRLGIITFLLSRLAAEPMAVDPGLKPYEPHPVDPPSGVRYVLPDGSIHVAGAEHAKFILDGFDALFARTHPGFTFTLDLKGTTTGIPFLAHDLTPFAPLGRDVSPREVVQFKELNGTEPLEFRVAQASNTSLHLATSLAVYVNIANPVDRLKMDQVTRIFTSGNPKGDFSRWGQVGATGEWAARPTHAIMTPEYTGFGIYMEKAHFGNRPMRLDQVLDETAQILKRVGEDPSAIGIAAIGRATPQIRMVALEAKGGEGYSLGTPGDIASGKYPLHRYLFFYVRRLSGKPVDPFTREYFRLIFSREGQEIIASEKDGYMPLTAAQAAAELAKLD
jgi:phosphate transport system substrate-binding protein